MADHLYSARGIPRIRLAYTAYPARQDDNGRRFRMHEIVLLPILSTAGEFSKDEGFINNFHRRISPLRETQFFGNEMNLGNLIFLLN